ncbi:hypothetical protein INT47_001231 [Mucor saturninus]|uniref:BHLH domain-containing protein n=1 Tax=Mucor saturninus TaxID=64648 RepID=A0A8H7RQF8_9FUNG|nr:hypothetical protein INT47_001231 [Mucor saturninus]
MSSNSNKRKHSESSLSCDESPKSARQTMSVPPPPPPLAALPPPLMQYPNGHIVPYYYQQFYCPISPQQHPFSMEPHRNSMGPLILPKATHETITPLSSPAGALGPQPPPPFYPYLQMSPQTTPTPVTAADQREKARKVSHSAIERRRRERINDKIMQLKQLIPTCAEQDNLHKMSILQSAIDYIAYLKDVVKTLDGNDDRLKGGHLRIKMAKSMLPKEVEPFTTQFSVRDEQKRALKPMDLIKSSAPLTPPQEPTKPAEPSSPILEPKHMSLQNILC